MKLRFQGVLLNYVRALAGAQDSDPRWGEVQVHRILLFSCLWEPHVPEAQAGDTEGPWMPGRADGGREVQSRREPPTGFCTGSGSANTECCVGSGQRVGPTGPSPGAANSSPSSLSCQPPASHCPPPRAPWLCSFHVNDGEPNFPPQKSSVWQERVCAFLSVTPHLSQARRVPPLEVGIPAIVKRM